MSWKLPTDAMSNDGCIGLICTVIPNAELKH